MGWGPRKNMTEAQIQAACFLWAWNTFPEFRGMFFSIPNGGWRNPAERALQMATGLVPGVWDMILFGPGGLVTFVEFKVPGGRLSKEQEQFRAAVGTRARWEVITDLESWQSLFCRTYNIQKNILNDLEK